MAKSKARIEAEKEWCKLLDNFDPSGYNSTQYRNTFNTLSDEEFNTFMSDIIEEKQYISIEMDSIKDKITLDNIFDICEEHGYKTHKYIMYRENSSGGNTSMTPYPALILYVPVKRLQQMLGKKNAASGDNDKINLMTGTVTGDSKAASINDTQTIGLITTNQFNVIKELLGPRADDEKSKKAMLHAIESRGSVALKDLHIAPHNKQAITTTQIFLKSVGIELKIK